MSKPRNMVTRGMIATRRNAVHRDRRRLEDAAVGPWRCTGCGVAVRPGMGDPCKCIDPRRAPE